jgi:CubicO group peptidase (beta-lactamase class C family)
VRILFVTAAVIALSACNSQQPAQPAPSAVPTPTADPEPTLPRPDQAIFAAAYAEACPKAKKVSVAVCESEGFGKPGFSCGYGLGDDPYQRNHARLEPGDGKWVLADPATACAAGDTTDSSGADSGTAQ